MTDPLTLQHEIHRNNIDHGFWAEERSNLYEKLALAHSEISEALEVLRDGHDPAQVWYRTTDSKPEGFGMELADTVIRLLDVAERCGIDLWGCVEEKHEFNKSRPFMHGKQA